MSNVQRIRVGESDLLEFLQQPGVPAEGTTWRHWEGDVYRVVAVGFLKSDLVIHVCYRRPGSGVAFIVPLPEFIGETREGVKRFVEDSRRTPEEFRTHA